ncbi:MAG: PIG-L deacetylase family protein [Anaerolineae bacterium]|nr:PIG-L deacetylase family protein [Anaerolineae bacterium]MDQ7037188.1 PIG-L deacetylase family protein [Anaerolineae bacterium]
MTEQKLKSVETLPSPFKIVFIVAHHDDIEFGAAGSVACWVEQGADITYVVITDGGAGSNEPGVVRSELAETRKKEQLAAAAAVGVTDVRFLGYPDGTLEPTMELRRELTRIIREVKPDRVICQDPRTVFFRDNYINHPDHRAAGEAAIYATFPSSETRPIFPELLDEGLEPHKVKELYLTLSLNPTHFVDISSTIEQKANALRAHVTQLGQGEDFENGALKWITEWGRETGKTVGVDYAEVFKVMTLVQANDNVREKDLEKAGTND